MKGKRYKSKRTTSIIPKIITSIFLFILIVIMVYSGIKIFEWFKENNNNKNIVADIQSKVTIDENVKDINKYNVDFEGLKQKNSDTIGWLKVYGTNIEYPVVKTINNDYYLVHSFDKNYNSSGWTFVDYKNKCDGTDDNIVVYAHNRRDGSLFGTLKNILDEKWYNNSENYKIPFILENEKNEYQVFSVYMIEEEDYYITTNFATQIEFQDFINTIKKRSIKDFGINVTSDDKILTLSTCANNNKYRVVLHAKKIIEEQ